MLKIVDAIKSSYNSPTLIPNGDLAARFDWNFPLFKWINICLRHLMPLGIAALYSDEKFKPEFKGGEFARSYDLSLTFGYALDGLTDTTHKADNI